MSKILEQLKAVPIFNNSVLNQELSLRQWEDAGSPYVWNLVETKKPFFVYYDQGYGYIALFHGETLIGWGKDQIINIEGYSDVMVLNIHAYGLYSYLWTPMEY